MSEGSRSLNSSSNSINNDGDSTSNHPPDYPHRRELPALPPKSRPLPPVKPKNLNLENVGEREQNTSDPDKPPSKPVPPPRLRGSNTESSDNIIVPPSYAATTANSTPPPYSPPYTPPVPPQSQSVSSKSSQCPNCGVLVGYFPNPDGKTLVTCYNCHITTLFNESEMKSTAPLVPPSYSSTTVSSQSQPTSTNYNNSSSNDQSVEKLTGVMKGAFKSMKNTGEVLKQKAVDTKKKVEQSDFMEKAKEKASVAAQKTKAAAQKATEQTKIAAQKASEQTKIVAHKVSEETKTIAQKTKDRLMAENEENETASGNYAQPAPAAPTAPQPVYATMIFGIPLEDAVTKSCTLQEDVPDIVYKCIVFLQEKGTREEGIFRLSGSSVQIKEIREAFDRGEDVDLSPIKDEHVVSGLLKLYFRELPEPMFSRASISDLKNIERLGDPSTQVSELSLFVNQLTRTRKTILHLLLQLLQEVVKNEETTKMNANNLAIVFSPTLGCPMEIMKMLITNFEDIFNYDLIDL